MVWWGHRYTPHDRICVLPDICSTVTILQHQWPWQRYALYCLAFWFHKEKTRSSADAEKPARCDIIPLSILKAIFQVNLG